MRHGLRIAIAVMGLLVALVHEARAQDISSIVVTRSFDFSASLGTGGRIECPPSYIVGQYTIAISPSEARPRVQLIPLDGLGDEIRQYEDVAPTAVPAVQLDIMIDQAIAPGTVTITIVCVRAAAALTTVVTDVTIPALSTGSLAGICPAGLVPIAQYGNVNNIGFSQRFRVYIFGNGPFTLLDDLPDGVTGPPTGIGLGVTNNTAVPKLLRLHTRCVPLPGAQVAISSAPTTPGDLFSLAGNLPDTRSFAGFSVVGGLYGSFRHLAIWGTDGSLSSQCPFDPGCDGNHTSNVRDVFGDGVDTRSKSAADKATARAVIGVLSVPAAAAAPPSTIVTIVEFLNAALDHYFITAIPKEISDLDTGVHKGWQRTGQTFKAYGPGSTGRTGRRPVCRAYGNPAANLDSHFYSASPLECVATLASFNGAWLLEASEVFQMDLPDTTTGACPAGGVPIYRVWNNRADSNHRYVASLALRDQMVARGYIAEGYGPNAVTLCGLQ